ncbi:hypothetical protein RJ640_012143, partial [Escallonia rubra]
MDLCPVSGRLPAIPLRSGQFPTSSTYQRAPSYVYVAPNCSRHNADAVTPESPNRMFILGMGFVGQFFAEQLKNQGWAVSGTCTSISKKKKLEEKGFNAYVFDANEPQLEVLNSLNYHTHVLISIPPVVGKGDPMLQHVNLLKRILDDENLQWLSYLSSTSVYGDCGGAWVDEDYLINPMSNVAKARLAAEEGWLNFGRDLGLAAQIFRLGGIYGPGRSAIDTIIKQEALSKFQRLRSSRHYTSRVHVADICGALHASIHRPSPGKIYNIVDDDPASRIEVFKFAQNLVEKKWPGQVKQSTTPDIVESSLSEGTLRGEKRVSNARVKRELGLRLLHPRFVSKFIDLSPALKHNLTNQSTYQRRGMKNWAPYCLKERKPCVGWVDKYFKDCLCNLRDEISFGFGLISLICWGVAEIPQIITNFRTKSSHGVSLLFLLTWIAGDVFNLVGCFLEPATLPTQFYTALLYTISTVVLVLQSVYYDYIDRWWKSQHADSTKIEEAKEPLKPQKKQDEPSIKIPESSKVEAVPRMEFYYTSARSLAGSATPPVRSYLWTPRSGPSSAMIFDSDSSSEDETTDHILSKKHVTPAKPIPRSAGYGAFLATSASIPRTKASMAVYIGLSGRKLLQEHGTEHNVYGQWLGWMMAAIYMGGRIPQICLN